MVELLTSSMPVMPPPAILKVTFAVLSIVVGGVPFSASMLENCIEKQVARAAPMSSSGEVVPRSDSSERAFQCVGKVPSWEVSRLAVPLPDLRSPFQTALAELVTGRGMVTPLIRRSRPHDAIVLSAHTVTPAND